MLSFKQMALNAEVIALLQRVGLPTEDLDPVSTTFCGMWEDEMLCGVIAIEPYHDVGLLRSLAVSPAFRGRGQGEVLVGKAEELARRVGVEELYLLTVSSSTLFERCGFAHVARDAVPVSIRETRQFSGLCPATCAVMRKRI
ncbi:amino-acid N-acetyltransferase [Stenotrophomonas rhizophila]|uniref:Amino-acid N-acetyltransferase n=1 Tax=Stenotrophomonas rhizophila TaxID=216778 RepID=A0AAP5AEK8_9GAMM|nr:arsenic resistance N-acetyltransferase ArsN2 [Stenotrophomonas rhizophila]MDQ1107184.1 amino-acid N-acetyltransferase [Stenotrophomonas rhizophila]